MKKTLFGAWTIFCAFYYFYFYIFMLYEAAIYVKLYSFTVLAIGTSLLGLFSTAFIWYLSTQFVHNSLETKPE